MAIVTTYSAFRNTFATVVGLANDGLQIWPYAKLDVVGFTDTWTIPDVLPSGFESGTAWTITINGSANDAVAGVAEYYWYLSQRTDDVPNQYFTISHPDVLPNTRSGTVNIVLSALGQTLYPTMDSATILSLFTNVDLYVQRISDDAIQHKLLLEPLLGD